MGQVDLSEHKFFIVQCSKETGIPVEAVERVVESMILNGWREPATHRGIQFERHRSPVYQHSLNNFELGK